MDYTDIPTAAEMTLVEAYGTADEAYKAACAAYDAHYDAAGNSDDDNRALLDAYRATKQVARIARLAAFPEEAKAANLTPGELAEVNAARAAANLPVS